MNSFMMRKFARRMAAVALIAALDISLLGNVEVLQAKKNEKVSLPGKVSIKVGQTKTLKLKKAAKTKIKRTTWKVSSKKILKLSKKTKNSVKVKGVRTGSTKLKATVQVGRKKIVISTTVKVTKKSTGRATGKATEKPVTSTTPTSQPSAAPATQVPTAVPTPTPTVNPEIAMMEKFPAAASYAKTITPPALMTMLDGTTVTTKEQWEKRRQEIKCILQYYMYGIWRDGSEETVSYTTSSGNMTISVARGDAKASFKASITTPTGTAPEGGWPVIVAVGGTDTSFITEKGYAVISYTPTDIASDNTAHKGAFYTLYPYDRTDWKNQTGSVLAWAWGASKIVDALEKGAGKELAISPVNTIVTGVSRYGKAAAAAGAFEERFKVSMPVCSGYGGMTMARYNSNNLTYNLLPEFANDPKKEDVADLSAWKSSGGTEPINSLSGAGWFNEAYKKFNSYQNLPFDAHFIASMSAAENRYLFIVTGINSDMWSSPPGFWWCYQEAKPAFDIMGLSDHLALQMHLNLHGIETVDLCKLFTFTDYHFYNKTTDPATFPEPWNTILADFKLADLQTCIFASDANKEAYEAGKPVDPNTIPANPDNEIPCKIKIGTKTVDTVVKRSIGSDALVTGLTGVDAGKGFTFRYGYNKQYGFSYARFALKLPAGVNLSDFDNISFTCQTDGNYYGKKMAFVVNPLSKGMPEEIDYNYNTGAVTTAINVTGDTELPNNTSTAKELSLPIDMATASQVDGEELECSVYLHMECGEGQAQYTLSNISLNK